MMNIIFYRKRSIEHLEGLKAYFKEKGDFNIIVLTNITKIRDDIKMYDPGILVIDYNYATEKKFYYLKQIEKFDQKIYSLVAIPDFMGNLNIQKLAENIFIDMVIHQSATNSELELYFRFIVDKIKLNKEYEDYHSKYTEIIDEFNSYKDTLSGKDQKIKELNTYIQSIVIVDELTALYNEKYFNVQLRTMLQECKRYKENVCLSYIDIDNRSQIEEVYGQPGIDFVIREIAALLQRLTRSTDCVGVRDDHSLFMVVYKKIKVESVRVVVGRLKKRLEDYVFLFDNKQIRITVSIGMTSTINYFNNTYDFEDICAQSKIALDNAIKKGRNALIAYS